MSEPTLTEAQRVDLSAAVCQYRYHGYQFEPLSAAIGDMLAEATQQARADAVAATTKLDDLRHRIEALCDRYEAVWVPVAGEDGLLDPPHVTTKQVRAAMEAMS